MGVNTQLEKARVVMIPTDDKTSKIWLDNDVNKLIFDPVGIKNCTPQHLYVISDGEIKEKDRFIDSCNQITIHKNNGKLKSYGNYKIIATTDKSLKVEQIEPYDMKSPFHNGLPQPSKTFIEKYCKVGGIDDVLVEYYDKGRFSLEWLPYFVPKINANNEIIISFN